MKKLNQSYNLYPVYETVEVMHIVVKSGTLTIGYDSQERVIIKGDSRAIELIDIIYNQNPNSNPTEGHISFFNNNVFIFDNLLIWINISILIKIWMKFFPFADFDFVK